MRKLEIGTQKRISKRWEVMDILEGEQVDIVGDITDGIPVEDNTYDLIYMSHVLEHVPWFEVDNVLKEVYRVLAPKGKLEIFVPDLEKLVRAYMRKEIPDKWLKYNPKREPIKWFSGRLYAYGESRDDPNWHKSMFDKEYLQKCLKNAGFHNIGQITKPRGYDHGYINLGMKAQK